MSKKDTFKNIFRNSENLSRDEIKHYLNNTSSEEERFKVENKMLDDPFTADAIEGFQEFGSKMPDFNYDTFLQKVNAKAKPEAKVVSMPSSSFKLWRVAAGVALLIIGSVAIYLGQNNEQRLYTQFYETYESDFISLRDDSSSNVAENNLMAGMEDYEDGLYSQSIKHFEIHLTTHGNDEDALFYSGLALLESERYKEGIASLMKVRRLNKNYFREATWYAALAYLKQDKTVEAKNLVEELLEAKGRYYEKAKMLNSKL